jgi:hypothetical protein
LAGVVIVALVATIVVIVWRVTAGPRSEGAPPASTPPPPSAESTVDSLPSVLADSPSPSPSPPSPPPVPAADLVALAEQAATPGMTLGVAVLNVNTGEVAEGANSGRTFISASLSKLLVVVDMYDRQRAEGRTIDDADRALVERALTRSDDGAMNLLWGRYDGRGAVNRVAGKLGLGATRPPSDASQWGDTQVTAGDFVRIYQYILRDMAAEDRAVIVDALARTQQVAGDGFDQYFGLLGRGASDRVYAKQAWVPYRPAGYLLHSAGVVHDSRTGTDYAITLLSIQGSVSAPTARERLSTVAAGMLDALGAP